MYFGAPIYILTPFLSNKNATNLKVDFFFYNNWFLKKIYISVLQNRPKCTCIFKNFPTQWIFNSHFLTADLTSIEKCTVTRNQDRCNVS